MHPMERLRYVARAGTSGSADAAIVVAETVEAIARLRPQPPELVTVCRQLVQRNPACGPLWWLGSRLLAGGLDQLWDLATEIEADMTADRLADALPDGGRVLAIGCPELTARALVRRADVEVLAIDAGQSAPTFMRLLDRADVDVTMIDPAGAMAAARAVDVVLVETVATSDERAIVPLGAGALGVAAAAVSAPIWLVAGAGCRLPRPFVDAIATMAVPRAAPWEGAVEALDLAVLTAGRDRVAGPLGVLPYGPNVLAPDCPYTPELIPPTL